MLTTARRNLMQFLCYSVPVTDLSKQDELEYKVQLCQDFHDVLARIDPGWSELAMFAKRELHFYKYLNLFFLNFYILYSLIYHL